MTAEQDPEYRRKFYEELLPEMMRAGKTIVVITHDDRYLDELHLPALAYGWKKAVSSNSAQWAADGVR